MSEHECCIEFIKRVEEKWCLINSILAQMLYSIYDIKITLKSHFWRKELTYIQPCYRVLTSFITLPKSVNH